VAWNSSRSLGCSAIGSIFRNKISREAFSFSRHTMIHQDPFFSCSQDNADVGEGCEEWQPGSVIFFHKRFVLFEVFMLGYFNYMRVLCYDAFASKTFNVF
jgi:hypothetical protein